MSPAQEDEVWNRYKETFGQPPGAEFIIPAQSITWDISPIFLRDKAYCDRMEADLTRKTLEALKCCTRPAEELFAMDWNHPCYFFAPHAVATDAVPSSWPVRVLPNGDFYTFLAQDFRFGVFGNCVDMTVCVFGRKLLDAFSETPPIIFNRPTWTSEERRAKEEQWAGRGWNRLTVGEKEVAWERFDSKFGFYARRINVDSPAIAEPTPSITWAIAPGAERNEAQMVDLTLKLLAGMKKATRQGERLYALDALRWYEHYTFDPHSLESAARESWGLPVFPDDNYVIFFAPDFRFGFLGNPLEKTFCIFGSELLEAMGNAVPLVFGKMLRRNGKDVAV